MIQINCQGLALGYHSALMRDLNFTVHAGDYLCILGENGAGKSTDETTPGTAGTFGGFCDLWRWNARQ